MSRHRKSRKNRKLPKTSDDKKVLPTTNILRKDKIHFRFDHFNAVHHLFTNSQFTNEWPVKLIKRFKDLQNCLVSRFRTDMRFRESQHVHKINWEGANLDSFGILNGEECDEDAWQFGITARGRVHGFFIVNLFYVVWLDPEHKLFDCKDPADN